LFIIALLTWSSAAQAQDLDAPDYSAQGSAEASVEAGVDAEGSTLEYGADTGASGDASAAANVEAPDSSSGWQASSTSSSTPAAGSESRGDAQATGDDYRMAHRFALGAHTHMSGAFLSAYSAATRSMSPTAAHPWLNLSLLINLTPVLTLDIFAGFVLGGQLYSGGDNTGHEQGDGITGFETAVGPRLLVTLARGEHSRLYTGVGLALLIGYLNRYRDNDDPTSSSACPTGGCNGYDMFGFALAAPVGFEYRFQSVPNLLFSAEINFHFVFESVGERSEKRGSTDIASNSHYNHIILGLGNPREPGSTGNILDYLTFLTIGFHYML
jgi:hypothetical protein